jgi:hypothetical protein
MYDRVSLPGKGKDFSFFFKFHTGYGFYPVPSSKCTAGYFPGVKRPERHIGLSPPSSALVNNSGAISQLSDMNSRHGA